MIAQKKRLVLHVVFALTLLVPLASAAWAQTVFTEKGINQSLNFNSSGALTGVTHQVAESDGGPVDSNFGDVGYPPNSVIEIEATLTVEKGSYKMEFQKQGETTLTLEAENGSSAEGTALVSIDSMGNLPYTVASSQAENVVLTLKVR